MRVCAHIVSRFAGVNGTTVTNNTFVQNGDGSFDGPSLSAPAGENANVAIRNNVIERIASGSGASGYSEVGNCVLSGGLSSTVKVPSLGLDPRMVEAAFHTAT